MARKPSLPVLPRLVILLGLTLMAVTSLELMTLSIGLDTRILGGILVLAGVLWMGIHQLARAPDPEEPQFPSRKSKPISE